MSKLCKDCVHFFKLGNRILFCTHMQTRTEDLVRGGMKDNGFLLICSDERDSWKPWACGKVGRHFKLKDVPVTPPSVDVVPSSEVVPSSGREEGDVCNRDGCTGVMGYEVVEGCTCHVSPPCHRCVDNPLVCLECGEGEEETRLFKDVPS